MKSKLPPETELLTKKELAKILKVSTKKIESDKSIPTIRWGRNVRYSLPEVMNYLREGGPKA